MQHDTIFRFHYTHTSDKVLVQPVTLGLMHQILQWLWELFAQPLDLIVAADTLLIQPVTLGHMHQILQSLWELFAHPLDLIVAVGIARPAGHPWSHVPNLAVAVGTLCTAS